MVELVETAKGLTMPKQDAKKSETIEIRVSYDTKRQLSKKAQSEGRTVSSVLRALIDGYLTPARAASPQPTTGVKISKLKRLLRKPQIIAASALAALSTSLFFIPSAMADDISINILGEIVRTDQFVPDSVSTKRFETMVLMSNGSMIEIDLGGEKMDVSPKPMKMQLQINETHLANGEEGILITMTLIEETDGTEVIIAQPSLKGALNQPAQFAWGTEGIETFDFKLVPRKG